MTSFLVYFLLHISFLFLFILAWLLGWQNIKGLNLSPLQWKLKSPNLWTTREDPAHRI